MAGGSRGSARTPRLRPRAAPRPSGLVFPRGRRETRRVSGRHTRRQRPRGGPDPVSRAWLGAPLRGVPGLAAQSPFSKPRDAAQARSALPLAAWDPEFARPPVPPPGSDSPPLRPPALGTAGVCCGRALRAPLLLPARLSPRPG